MGAGRLGHAEKWVHPTRSSWNSGQEVWSLVKSWHGALPEWRREELEMEELLSKSEFPFSEHCPLSDVT